MNVSISFHKNEIKHKKIPSNHTQEKEMTKINFTTFTSIRSVSSKEVDSWVLISTMFYIQNPIKGYKHFYLIIDFFDTDLFEKSEITYNVVQHVLCVLQFNNPIEVKYPSSQFLYHSEIEFSLPVIHNICLLERG